jgi:chromosome segregation ATPase
MAVDLAKARWVGWHNPRSGVLHPLKLSVHPAGDWQPLYVLDESPEPEYTRLVEIVRQAQMRNRTLLHRLKRLRRHIRELEDALNRRRAEGLRSRLLIGELEDQLGSTRARMDDWREVANDRTKRIAELEDEVEYVRAEWHKVNNARREYAIENSRLRAALPDATQGGTR